MFVLAFLFMLLCGPTVAVYAEASGIFSVDLSLNPQTNSVEAVPFDIDFEANLDLSVTLSGLTFLSDLGFGVTGVEFAILGVRARLGALEMGDMIVFATPFASTAFPAEPTSTTITPTTDALGNPNGLAFVKKRAWMTLTFAGVSVGVLAIFEDVDFPDTSIEDDHEHDHFNPNLLVPAPDGTLPGTYYVGATDGVVDNQTPSFAFGAVFTFSGQTISGITVTSETGVCADPTKRNRIKKRDFYAEADKACADNSSPPFHFSAEVLKLEGVNLGGLSFGASLIILPTVTSLDLEVGFSVAGLLSLQTTMTVDDVTTLTPSTFSLTLASAIFRLTWEDTDGDLEIDKTTVVFGTTVNPQKSPACIISTTVIESGLGITSETLTLCVSRLGLSLSSSTEFVNPGTGTLSWDETTFDASASVGILTFGAGIVFKQAGLESAHLSFIASF